MWQKILLIGVLICAVYGKMTDSEKKKSFIEAQKKALDNIKHINRIGLSHHHETWASLMEMTRKREEEIIHKLKERAWTMELGEERDSLVHKIRILEKRLERFAHPDMFKNPSERSFYKKEKFSKGARAASNKTPED